MANGRLPPLTREEFLALEQRVEECLQNLDLQVKRIKQVQAELHGIREAWTQSKLPDDDPPSESAHHHQLSYWTNLHDNDWVTYVNEQPDGTFIAWAAPVGEDPVTTAYIEDSEENAKLAAEFVVKTHTGHVHCSAKCSGWRFQQPISDITPG